MVVTGKSGTGGVGPVPVPLRPPQIPNGLCLDKTGSLHGKRLATARAKPRPSSPKIHPNIICKFTAFHDTA
jgi:hypothetical protein